MGKDKNLGIILKEGTFTIEEICEMCQIKLSTFTNQISRNKEKISKHCDIVQNGRGKNATFTLSNVPTEPITKKEFGKDSNKTRKVRSDKGMKRDGYDTIKEQFKPLIYSLLLSKPNYTYTGSFNNWMQFSKITNMAWGQMNRKYMDGEIKDRYTNAFFNIEGKSLNYMFNQALTSMVNEGIIEKEEVRIAVIDNRDIIAEFGDCDGNIPFSSYRILENEDREEVDKLENEILEKFGVEKLSDLAYGNWSKRIERNIPKLKKFKREFNERLFEKFGYDMSFRATKVQIKEDIDIEYVKLKYGITDDMQDFVNKCKDEIYDSRFKRAKKRYSKSLDELEELKRKEDVWYDIDGLIKEEIKTRDKKLTIWDENYRKFIHKDAKSK